MAVLQVRELRKVFPGKTPFVAVDGISFELRQGEILGLLGPNGAGKTTTIQMLLSTLKPTSGDIFYFGQNFCTHRSEILKRVAFASTYGSLPWGLNVRQNLEVFGRLYEVPLDELRKRIDELLERFGISEKKCAKITSLSAGQITRLMLVKAFMVKPQLVLLDEPTASLDPDIAQDVCQFVLEQRQKEGLSVLFTSHNMAEVTQVCDRVLFLRTGKIIADDHPKKLARSISSCQLNLIVTEGMQQTEAIAQTFNLSFKTENRAIEIMLEESQIPALLKALAVANVVYTHISINHPTLEDYFLKMSELKKKARA